MECIPSVGFLVVVDPVFCVGNHTLNGAELNGWLGAISVGKYTMLRVKESGVLTTGN